MLCAHPLGQVNDLDDVDVTLLKNYCKQHGTSNSGKRNKLIKRVRTIVRSSLICLREVNLCFYHEATDILRRNHKCFCDEAGGLMKSYKSVLDINQYDFYSYDFRALKNIVRDGDEDLLRNIEHGYGAVSDFLSCDNFFNFQKLVMECPLSTLKSVYNAFIIPKQALACMDWHAFIVCMALQDEEKCLFLAKQHNLHSCDYKEIDRVLEQFKNKGVREIRNMLLFVK